MRKIFFDKLSIVLEDKTQRTTLKKGGFDMIGKMAKTRQRRHLRQLAGFSHLGTLGAHFFQDTTNTAWLESNFTFYGAVGRPGFSARQIVVTC
jgi:hypothetical protein